MKPWVVFTGAKQKKTDWNRQGLPENCPIRNACLWFLLQIVLLVCTNEFDPGHGGTEALLSWRTRVLLTTCSDVKSIYPGRIRKSLWVSEREGVREQGTCCIQSINDIHTHVCNFTHNVLQGVLKSHMGRPKVNFHLQSYSYAIFFHWHSARKKMVPLEWYCKLSIWSSEISGTSSG